MINVSGVGKVEVVDVRWFSVPNYQNRLGEQNSDFVIGIVKLVTEFNEEKCYIGVVKLDTPKKNLIELIKTGVPYV